jgi:hypothetical protein
MGHPTTASRSRSNWLVRVKMTARRPVSAHLGELSGGDPHLLPTRPGVRSARSSSETIYETRLSLSGPCRAGSYSRWPLTYPATTESHYLSAALASSSPFFQAAARCLPYEPRGTHTDVNVAADLRADKPKRAAPNTISCWLWAADFDHGEITRATCFAVGPLIAKASRLRPFLSR